MRFFLFLACLAVAWHAAPSAWAQMSPFVLPWDDASGGSTDLSQLNAPISEDSRLRVDSDGHFSAAGRRVRLLGVNLAGDSPFVPTNRADAMAARLARFGFNSVRFHHIDAPWAVGGGLIRYTSTSSRQIQAAQLERVQFLIARLAAHGIYSDINLITGREFRSGDGLGGAIRDVADWKDQHLLALFNDVALNLHKEYATQILAPVNRFTGVPLARDPSVAFIEILNENGFLHKWYEGALDRLPGPYDGQLQTRWNEWLANRYVDDAALRAAWKVSDQPLGPNLLRNGAFSSGVTSWALEQHSGAAATVTRTLDFNGGPSARLAVTRVGSETWHVQFNQRDLRLVEGQMYTLTFSARASEPGPLDVSVMMAHDPWQTLGLGTSVSLTTGWQTFTRSFIASADDANARVNFGGIGTRVTTVWLADVRLQTGGEAGAIPGGAALADRTIPRVRHGGDGFTGTDDARRDWIRFAIELENRYYDAMVGHLRDELGYTGLIFGTIMANSPVAVQSRLDVIDSHAYWQHPEFPGTAWDPLNFRVRNVSLVNAPPSETTLAYLARQRIRGKPFTVTEYQHSSPNSYSAEGPLLLAAYAALQDWDGVWLFDYGWGSDAPLPGNLQPMGRFQSFFDVAQHPAKMANVPLAATLFRRGDLRPALGEIAVPLNPGVEMDLLLRRAGAWSVFTARHLEVPGGLAFRQRLSVDYRTNAPPAGNLPGEPATYDSDTGELQWHPSTNTGHVTYASPRSWGAIGFVSGRTLALGEVEVRAETNSLNWATIGLTLVRGTNLAEGGTALLVATARCENTGLQWRDAARESLASWGRSPTLIETVGLRLTLPVAAGRVQAWVLDERGQRRAPARLEPVGETRVALITRTADATLWYEIEVAPANSASFEAWRRVHFTPGELIDPAVSGPQAAPAGDQVANLVKYAFGRAARTPTAPGDLIAWGLAGPGGARQLWLSGALREPAPDVEVIPWFSRDLTHWSVVPWVQVGIGDGQRHVRVESAIPPSSSGHGFWKVEVRPVGGGL